MIKQLPIMSVSGIRGTMGGTISPYLFSAIAYLQTKQAGGGEIIIGRDTRPSGEILAAAVCRGIRCAGGTAVDIGIAPTPTTCFATGRRKAAGGVIITASHNPHPYNGYKMVHGSGRLFSGTECQAIYDRFIAGDYPAENDFLSFSDTPHLRVDACADHVAAIIASVDTGLIRSYGLTIAIDAINGAASAIFPQLCEALGVRWYGVNTTLSGDFVHNPEPRPEHLGELAALLKSRDDFWGGFAFDPDADRLATLGEHGEPVSEEMTLALALDNVLQRDPSDVAVNLSTSMVIDDVALKYGVNVIRTKIGEANVVEGMKAHGVVIGGEGNGGVIYPKISTVRDGLTALALILEHMARSNMSLCELVSQWPKYAIVKEKIPVGSLVPTEVITRLIHTFAEETIDIQDGLKIIRPYGWVQVRPSNTEPILRCFAEAQTDEQARELATMVMKAMQ